MQIRPSENYYDSYLLWSVPIINILNIILIVASMIGLSSLVLQFGFFVPGKWENVLNRIDLFVIQYYLVQYISKVLLAKDKIHYIRNHWFETILSSLIILELLLFVQALGLKSLHTYTLRLDVTTLTEIYIGIAQALILLTLIVSAIRYNTRFLNISFHPAQTILTSFLMVIFFGALLLMLPKATYPNHHIHFIDALFTSVSAVCVTGLTVVDTATYFTRHGQIIILCLIQIGGLGIITFSSFLALFFGQGIGIRDRIVIREMLNMEKIGTISEMLRKIILLTFTIELLGAITLMIFWWNQGWSLGTLIYNSIFHSIAAFCNAGFSTFSNNLTDYSHHPGILLTIGSLIVLGGIGFVVILDVGGNRIFFTKQTHSKRLSVQTRMVLLITGILLVVGTLILYILDRERIGYDRLLTSIFSSITARTAGFNAIDYSVQPVPYVLIIIMLMFIGASPGSTGGGIKTTTLGVLVKSIIEIVSGQNRIILYKRRLPFLVLNRALVVFAFSVIVVFLAVFILSIFERASLIDLLFEAVSAYGTVGLSRNLTPSLSIAGKIVIMTTMFIGRLGALTLAFAITAPSEKNARIEYPSESVMIG